jgi:FHS family L-fucose permease-like MFS transporter
MDTTDNKKELTFSFICITFLFFAWGFITCMNDLLIPKFKSDFNLTQLQANLIQSAFFGAFFIVSLVYFLLSKFKGDPINKIGYKNGLVIGLIVCGIGCLLFYPAAQTHTYWMFLFALLTLGSGVTIIQIAANPYISILGSESTATSRLNLSQGINSLGYVIAPVIGGLLLFGNNVYKKAGGVDSVKMTYVSLGICFLVLALIIKLIKLPEFKTKEPTNVSFNIFETKHFAFGLLAIFFYVGSEVTIGSILINYLGDKTIVGIPVNHADKYLSFYWGGLMIGRLVGAISLSSAQGLKKYGSMILVASISTLIIFGTATFKNYLTSGVHINVAEIAPFIGIIILNFIFFFIAGKSAGKTIGYFSIVAGCLTLVAMTSSGEVALWSIIGIGLFNSIMWSNIFTLSIKGMNEKTSKASSLLVMMIVGGAILPVIQGALADSFSIRMSLVVVLIGYSYLTFFGFKGSKVVANA